MSEALLTNLTALIGMLAFGHQSLQVAPKEFTDDDKQGVWILRRVTNRSNTYFLHMDINIENLKKNLNCSGSSLVPLKPLTIQEIYSNKNVYPIFL